MDTLNDWIDFVCATLQHEFPDCIIHVVETQQFSAMQFALKVRAELGPGSILQVRLYQNRAHTDYAYHFIRGV